MRDEPTRPQITVRRRAALLPALIAALGLSSLHADYYKWEVIPDSGHSKYTWPTAAINDHGVVASWSGGPSLGGYAGDGFLYDAGINTLIPKIAPYSISRPTAINNSSVVVGYGLGFLGAPMGVGLFSYNLR